MMYCFKHDPYKDINYEKPSCFPLIFERMYSLMSLSIHTVHYAHQYTYHTYGLFYVCIVFLDKYD